MAARTVITTRHMGLSMWIWTSILASQHDLDNNALLKPITDRALHTVTIMGRVRDRNLGGHDLAHYPSAKNADLFLLSRGLNLRELNL